MEEALRIEDNPIARMATRFQASKAIHFRDLTKMMLVLLVVRKCVCLGRPTPLFLMNYMLRAD